MPYDHECDDNVLFHALEVIHKYNTGEIIMGILKHGRINIGDQLIIGQIDNDHTIIATVKSIQKKQIPYQRADKSADILALTLDQAGTRYMTLTHGKYNGMYANKIIVKLNERYIGKFQSTNNPIYAFIGNYCNKADVLNVSDDGMYVTICIQNISIICIDNNYIILKKYRDLYIGKLFIE